MRGRVSAVNNVFIGASNELGGFESGLTAKLFGLTTSIVGGEIGTLLVVFGVDRVFPQVAGSFAHCMKPSRWRRSPKPIRRSSMKVPGCRHCRGTVGGSASGAAASGPGRSGSLLR